MKFRTLTFSQFAFSTALIFAIIIWTDLGLFGIAMAEAIAFGGTILILAPALFRQSRPDFGLLNWGSLWAYAYPLSIHAFCTWAICYADRIILGDFVGLEDVGIYHIGYLLATVISTITLSVKNAWLPDFFKSAELDSGNGGGFSFWLLRYIAFVLLLALGVICIGPPLASLFLSDQYVQSEMILRLVSVSLVFQAVFAVLLNPLYYARRTKSVAAISGISLAINIVTMYAIVPFVGITGAALATIVSYGSAMSLAYWQASKHYGLSISWGILVRSFLLFLLIAYLSSLPMGNWVNQLAWGIFCIMLYVVITLSARNMFLSHEDAQQLTATLRQFADKMKISGTT